MSRARAPGKLVLSGAYAVLEGAPAIVTAVDRYVVADAARPADRTTPEVAEALRARGTAHAPWFDADGLREGSRKLGLGSSAAILVASLGALELAENPSLNPTALGHRVLGVAIEAHRRAQGGGSGIDVAASALGGTRRCVLASGDLTVSSATLPSDVVVEVWSSPHAASTPEMLRRVAAFRDASAAEHRALMAALMLAAERAAIATRGTAFVAALRDQVDALVRLGVASNAPIVTAPMVALDALARAHDGVMLPSGAGGGDVVLWVGPDATPEALAAAASRAGFARLPLALDARGLHPAE